MKISDSIAKIYVLGPSGSGKSTFIQKHFAKELQLFENLIIESSEMIVPENSRKVYLILPDLKTLKERSSSASKELEESYYRWHNFYEKNSSSIDIHHVKEF